MDTSLSWIKAYVPDLDVTAQEYTDAMTLSGTKVEGFTKLDADLDKIVVGQIEKIEQHPDADTRSAPHSTDMQPVPNGGAHRHIQGYFPHLHK